MKKCRNFHPEKMFPTNFYPTMPMYRDLSNVLTIIREIILSQISELQNNSLVIRKVIIKMTILEKQLQHKLNGLIVTE